MVDRITVPAVRDWALWDRVLDGGWLSLNLAYLVYAVSGLFRDMLRLRLTLLGATALFIIYGVVAEIWSVFWWNLPVATVHAWGIWMLLKQRRAVNLNAEAEAVRTLLYPDLDRVSFNQMWHASDEHTVSNKVLITKGEPVDELFLILDGDVDVAVRDDLVVRLGRLRIVGEMSSVTGGNATATVTANDNVRIRTWNKEKFARLLEDHPEIERAHLRAIGHELTRKLT